MATFGYDNLAAGAEALRLLAIKTACEQAAIPVGGDARPSHQQQQDTAMIEAGFAGIPAMFYPFLEMPAPDDFQPILDELRNTAHYLNATQNAVDPELGPIKGQNTEFALVTSVADNLASWSGAAAREFKVNYLDPLPIHTAGQFNVVAMCIRLVQQEQGIWREAQKNVATLLNDAMDCLEDMPGRCGKNGWTTTLTVIAAVATFAAVPLAGFGTATLAGLALADGIASTGATLLPDDPPKNLRFSASTAPKVISEVQRGLNELINRIVEQEGKIGQVMNGAAAVLTQDRATFVPKRPLLANVTRANVMEQNSLGFTS